MLNFLRKIKLYFANFKLWQMLTMNNDIWCATTAAQSIQVLFWLKWLLCSPFRPFWVWSLCFPIKYSQFTLPYFLHKRDCALSLTQFNYIGCQLVRLPVMQIFWISFSRSISEARHNQQTCLILNIHSSIACSLTNHYIACMSILQVVTSQPKGTKKQAILGKRYQFKAKICIALISTHQLIIMAPDHIFST